MKKSFSISDPQSPSSTTAKPILPWKTRLAVTLLSAVTDRCRRPDGTINRRLLKVLDFKTPPNPTKPIDQIVSSDITVEASRNLWFRLFKPVTPAPATSLPVIIFFHGGGFTFLSPASKAYDAVCRRFALKLQAIVISVNYRLAPEHRFPSQYDDGLDTLKFLDENPSVLPGNADLSQCFLAGDSAGANIAHHVAVRVCQEKFKRIRVIGLFSIQPFFGGVDRTESEIRLSASPIVSVSRTDWLWKVFLPDGSDRDHHAANVSGPNAVDISGVTDFPDTVVVVGGFDALQDWQRKYYEWLKKSGVGAELIEFPNMIHAFYIFPELPESAELIGHFKNFVLDRCSKIRN